MNICHDCGCREGEIHKWGCDMERCPDCGGQLITCDCAYARLGIDCSPGTWAYVHGLTEDQEIEWLAILEEKGRVPFIVYPTLCARCGEVWPAMFSVPDEEWERYVEPSQRHKMLCRECYREIKWLIDKGQRGGERQNEQDCGAYERR